MTDWRTYIYQQIDRITKRDGNLDKLTLKIAHNTWKTNGSDNVTFEEYIHAIVEKLKEYNLEWLHAPKETQEQQPSEQIEDDNLDRFNFDVKWETKYTMSEYIDWVDEHQKFRINNEVYALTGIDLAVYHYFVRYVKTKSADYTVSTTVRKISEKVRFSARSVHRSLKTLIELGLITPQRTSKSKTQLSKYKVIALDQLRAKYGDTAARV